MQTWLYACNVFFCLFFLGFGWLRSPEKLFRWRLAVTDIIRLNCLHEDRGTIWYVRCWEGSGGPLLFFWGGREIFRIEEGFSLLGRNPPVNHPSYRSQCTPNSIIYLLYRFKSNKWMIQWFNDKLVWRKINLFLVEQIYPERNNILSLD